MYSKTKNRLTDEEIRKLLSTKLPDIQQIKELTDGEFNAAYRVTDSDGRSYFLKIAPKQTQKVMFYEQNLMKNELNLLKIANEATLKSPVILHSSKPNSYCAWYIAEFFEHAVPMNQIRLKRKEKKKVLYALGAEMAKMHEIKGETFGYTHQQGHISWIEAYREMLMRAIEDAEKVGVILPYYEKVCAFIEKNIGELEAVKEPVFTHFDIWEGNVFIDRRTKEFYGLIDFERGYFGDFAGDFISLQFVRSILQKNVFLDGYRSVRPLIVDKNLKIRMSLLKIYLGIIIATEKEMRLEKNVIDYKVKKFLACFVIKRALKLK